MCALVYSREQFPILFPLSATSPVRLSLDNFRRKAQVWQAYPGTASQTALGIYKVKQQENSLSQWETFFAPARTSNIKTAGPLTGLAEHREEGEINGTLNPIKLEREAWGLQPVFLWRCSKSTWKQGVEEALCSGGDTHGPESKWLIFKHPFRKCVCVWVLNLKCSLWWACKCESSTVCLMPFYVYTPSVGVCVFFFPPLRSLVQLCKKPLTRYLSHTAGPPQQRLVVRASLAIIGSLTALRGRQRGKIGFEQLHSSQRGDLNTLLAWEEKCVFLKSYSFEGCECLRTWRCRKGTITTTKSMVSHVPQRSKRKKTTLVMELN